MRAASVTGRHLNGLSGANSIPGRAERGGYGVPKVQGRMVKRRSLWRERQRAWEKAVPW